MTQPIQIFHLACNKCGATLQVRPGAQYVTCGYCGSQLMVHNDGGTLTTEVIGRIDQRTENIERNVEILRLQQELEDLDRNWTQSRGNQTGTPPANATAVKAVGTFAGIMMMGTSIVGGIIWMILTGILAIVFYNIGAPWIVFLLPLPGLVFIGFGIVTGTLSIIGTSKAAKLAAEHETKRQRILQEIARHQQTDKFTREYNVP